MCINRDGQIDDYKLLMFDNHNYALQERKGRKGKKEGIRGGNEGKEKERIDRRKGNDK